MQAYYAACRPSEHTSRRRKSVWQPTGSVSDLLRLQVKQYSCADAEKVARSSRCKRRSLYCMPKKARLTGSEIRRLRPEKRLNTSLFSLSISVSDGEGKVACVVSKKVSMKAVVRNAIKRRMRTALRSLAPLPTGVSLLLTAKKQAVGSPYALVRDDVAQMIQRVRSGK